MTGWWWWVVDDFSDKVSQKSRREIRTQIAHLRPGAKPPWVFRSELDAVRFMVVRSRQRVEEMEAKLKNEKKRAWHCEQKLEQFLGQIARGEVDPGERQMPQLTERLRDAEPEAGEKYSTRDNLANQPGLVSVEEVRASLDEPEVPNGE